MWYTKSKIRMVFGNFRYLTQESLTTIQPAVIITTAQLINMMAIINHQSNPPPIIIPSSIVNNNTCTHSIRMSTTTLRRDRCKDWTVRCGRRSLSRTLSTHTQCIQYHHVVRINSTSRCTGPIGIKSWWRRYNRFIRKLYIARSYPTRWIFHTNFWWWKYVASIEYYSVGTRCEMRTMSFTIDNSNEWWRSWCAREY